MRIIRGRNKAAVKLIEKHLIDSKYEAQGTMKEVVLDNLRHSPEETWLSLAVEGNEVKGFVVALAPVGRGFVFIYQVWVAPDAPKGISENLFHRLVLWADAVGASQLRGETFRSSEALYRRWGFGEFSKVLKFDIDQDYFTRVTEAVRKEIQVKKDSQMNGESFNSVKETEDGRKLGTDSDEDEHADEGTESSGTGPAECDNADAGEGVGAVSGAESSEPGAGSPGCSNDDTGIQPDTVRPSGESSPSDTA